MLPDFSICLIGHSRVSRDGVNITFELLKMLEKTDLVGYSTIVTTRANPIAPHSDYCMRSIDNIIISKLPFTSR